LKQDDCVRNLFLDIWKNSQNWADLNKQRMILLKDWERVIEKK
jgi:hypothetical protein